MEGIQYGNRDSHMKGADYDTGIGAGIYAVIVFSITA